TIMISQQCYNHLNSVYSQIPMLTVLTTLGSSLEGHLSFLAVVSI
ncbi:6690_t:CDS:1, partial [Cetraspora pellucida]